MSNPDRPETADSFSTDHESPPAARSLLPDSPSDDANSRLMPRGQHGRDEAIAAGGAGPAPLSFTEAERLNMAARVKAVEARLP